MSKGRLALAIIVGVTFALGFVAGYKAKECRIRWLKRRRDRLAEKLVDTQRQIELHQKNY